jgi:hypothetical protein
MMELHISNLSHCKLNVKEPIRGALHVTSCHQVQLHLPSFHQLRLHDSTFLNCHVKDPNSSGGAIMEDCSNVVFDVTVIGMLPPTCSGNSHTANNTETAATTNNHRNDDPSSALLMDVKDFNWLRNGVPSPNFRIVEVVQQLAAAPLVQQEDRAAADNEGNKNDCSAAKEQETIISVAAETKAAATKDDGINNHAGEVRIMAKAEAEEDLSTTGAAAAIDLSSIDVGIPLMDVADLGGFQPETMRTGGPRKVEDDDDDDDDEL